MEASRNRARGLILIGELLVTPTAFAVAGLLFSGCSTNHDEDLNRSQASVEGGTCRVTTGSASLSTHSVSVGGTYELSCDFGVQTGNIEPVAAGSCVYAGWSNGPNGDTVAQYDCKAAGPGTFAASCVLPNIAPDWYCNSTVSAGDITVSGDGGSPGTNALGDGATDSSSSIPKGAWGSNQGVMWGVGTLVPDSPMSVADQITAVQDLGLKSIRVWCSGNGYHNPGNIVPAALAAGITPVVLIEAPPTKGAGEDANYQNGMSAAQTCVQQTGVGANVVYEPGNEVDNWVGMSGDGSDISQYDRNNYLDARGMIRGMIDGIKGLNSAAKVEVHNAGWCHYGFLKGLWADGVRWDITGEHWYGDQGDLLKAGCQNGVNILDLLHTSFGKPIVISENNVNANTTIGAFTKQQMASYFQAEMPELDGVAKQYDLESVDIFFLQDIPNYLNYGIYNGDGTKSEAYSVVKDYLIANPTVRYQ